MNIQMKLKFLFPINKFEEKKGIKTAHVKVKIIWIKVVYDEAKNSTFVSDKSISHELEKDLLHIR